VEESGYCLYDCGYEDASQVSRLRRLRNCKRWGPSQLTCRGIREGAEQEAIHSFAVKRRGEYRMSETDTLLSG